jgi:hypothetical protein
MVLTGGAYVIRFDAKGRIVGDVQIGPPSRVSDPIGQALAISILDN